MELTRHLCAVCGAQLTPCDGGFACPYCRAYFTDESEQAYALTLKGLLDEAKLERLSAARRLLFEAAHAKNPSSEEISHLATEVLSLYPDDELARFYKASCDADPKSLNEFLDSATLNPAVVEEVLAFLLRSAEGKNIDSCIAFAKRHLQGERLHEALESFSSLCEQLDEGMYEPSLPRDVFLAYSSKDIDRVRAMVSMLEKEGFTVFAAYRNLRHGKGAAENYKAALSTALAHCKALVFLSSKNSRSLSCDALTFELPHIQENNLPLKRIEYILDPYGPDTPRAVTMLLKDFFDGLEWCSHTEDLLKRLLEAKATSVHKPKSLEADPRLTILDNVVTAFTPGEGPKILVIPEGVVSIAPRVFREADIEHVSFPSTLRKIGSEAFQRSALLAIDFPESSALEEIGPYAFDSTRIAHFFFPEGMRSIGEFAFFRCDELLDVYLPKSVETIGPGAFSRGFNVKLGWTRYHIRLGKRHPWFRSLPRGYDARFYYVASHDVEHSYYVIEKTGYDRDKSIVLADLQHKYIPFDQLTEVTWGQKR